MPTETSAGTSASTGPAGGASTESRDAWNELAGLDALELETHEVRPWWRHVLTSAVPPMVAIAIVIGIWQLVFSLHIQPDYNLPSPSASWDSLRGLWDSGSLLEGIRNSLGRCALGFLIAIGIGTPLGLAMGRIKLVKAGIGPIVSGLQSLPSVAWVPVGVIWFGITPTTLYFVVLLGAVPSIAAGTASGLEQVPPLYLRVGHILGARGLTLARHVLLPAALPAYVGGLRQGWAFSWRSLMAAELIAQSPRLGAGLGQLLEQGRELSDMSVEFGVIWVILLVGLAVELIVFRPIERRVLSTRGLLVGKH
jgi:NitT/TauT family transport system permease protein